MPGTWQRWRRPVGFALGLALLAILVWHVWRQRAEIAALPWRLSWHPFAAVACIMLAQLLVGTGTAVHVRVLGGTAPWRQVVLIHLVAQAAKYLPLGGVLNITAQTTGLVSQAGASTSGSLLAVLLGLASICAAGLTAFGLADLLTGGATFGLAVALVAVAALPVMLLILAAGLLARLPDRLRVRCGLVGSARYGPADLLAVAAAGLLAWLLFGLSLVVLALSFGPLSFDVAVRVAGGLAAAWVLGVLSFVVPAGLGVRDGALALLLAGVLADPLPAILPLMSRVLWLLADLANAGLALLAMPRAFRPRESSVSFERNEETRSETHR